MPTPAAPRSAVSLWLKIPLTVLYVIISVGTMRQYSAFNFLWFSQIGFAGTVLALWSESRLLASMMLLNTFVADGVGWTLDFIVALATGRHPFGATAYMFDQRIPLAVRALSLFHVGLPVLLAWMVHKFSYARAAILAQALVALLVLTVRSLFTDPALNINCVFGPGTQRQTLLPAGMYFPLLLIFVPLAF